jgi:hypothetical protein
MVFIVRANVAPMARGAELERQGLWLALEKFVGELNAGDELCGVMLARGGGHREAS